MPSQRRGNVTGNANSLAHFPRIAGIIYISLGIEQVVSRLAGNQPPSPVRSDPSAERRQQPAGRMHGQ